MKDPSYPRLKAVKMILRYVKGTDNLGLFYQKANKFELEGFVNSDYCNDVDDRKSISGYTFFMRGTTFILLSKKHLIVSLLTFTEYVTASLGVSHKIWLMRLL
jgi:hypothetical protein